jgi:hypothetical protein
MISTVWTYRSLYSIEYEFWAVQACCAAAFLVMFDLDASPSRIDIFSRACQALYELGKVYPAAREVLLGISVMVRKHDIKMHDGIKKYLSDFEGVDKPTFMKDARVPVVLRNLGNNSDEVSVQDPNLNFMDLVSGFDGLDISPT